MPPPDAGGALRGRDRGSPADDPARRDRERDDSGRDERGLLGHLDHGRSWNLVADDADQVSPAGLPVDADKLRRRWSAFDQPAVSPYQDRRAGLSSAITGRERPLLKDRTQHGPGRVRVSAHFQVSDLRK